MTYKETVKNMHDQTREETIIQVNDAIEFIRANEGADAILSASKLAKISGLSRSLFYKEHVLRVWNYDLWEEKFTSKSQKTDKKALKDLQLLRREFEELENQLSAYRKKVLKLEDSLEKERKRKEVLQIDLEDEKETNAKLRGEILKLQQQASTYGK